MNGDDYTSQVGPYQLSLIDTLRRAPTLSQPTQGQPRPGSTRQRFYSEMEKLQGQIGQRPDTAERERVAQAQYQGAGEDIGPAILLQALGGRLAPLGGQILQRSLAARGPQKVTGGEIVGGKFIEDPYAARERQLKGQEFTVRGLESAATHEEKQAEEIRGHDLASQRHRETIEAGAQRHREVIGEQRARRAEATATREKKGDVKHLQRAGTTPAGELVTFDPGTGQQFVGDKLYTGPVMSQQTLDKQATTVQESLSALTRLKNLEGLVASNPNAFGGVAAISMLTPEIVRSRWQAAKLTPEERETRALVMTEAAQVINDLYGAAVSAGEMGRASQFVPTGLEDPATVAVKLKAAQAWASSKASQYGGTVRGAAEARSGGSPNAPRAVTPGGTRSWKDLPP